MKDVDSIGPTRIKAELKEAMDNRGAAYGVLVARSRASLTGGIGWFNEYDGNKLACAVEDAEGSPAMDGGMIQVAYRWARARVAGAPESRAGEVDAALVEEKAMEIGEHVEEAKSIKRECTNIDRSSKRIREWAESTEKGLKAKIDAIVESLGGGIAGGGGRAEGRREGGRGGSCVSVGGRIHALGGTRTDAPPALRQRPGGHERCELTQCQL